MMDLMQEASTDVMTREDLVDFIRKLRNDFSMRRDEWENNTLESYLEAVQAVLNDWPGRCKNQGKRLPRDPTWHLLAEVLLAATLYE